MKKGSQDWLDLQFNFWASPTSTDVALFQWLEGYSLMSAKEAIILPCRAYWTPLALKAMGQPPEVWERAVAESLAALGAQMNVLKAQILSKEQSLTKEE